MATSSLVASGCGSDDLRNEVALPPSAPLCAVAPAAVAVASSGTTATAAAPYRAPCSLLLFTRGTCPSPPCGASPVRQPWFGLLVSAVVLTTTLLPQTPWTRMLSCRFLDQTPTLRFKFKLQLRFKSLLKCRLKVCAWTPMPGSHPLGFRPPWLVGDLGTAQWRSEQPLLLILSPVTQPLQCCLLLHRSPAPRRSQNRRGPRVRVRSHHYKIP